MRAPSGTVTFLFTDIEGSTRLWERSPSAMGSALERHDRIVQAAIADHGGYVFATGGDGFAAAFGRAADAVAAAARAQTELHREDWPPEAPVGVRMAVHTGEVLERNGNYFGTPVNQAARLMAVAHGGQVLCSAVTAELVRAEVPLVDLGVHRLRDLSAPQRVFQVGAEQFPALETVDAVPTNLPTVRTELIGRSGEVAAVTRLLGQHRLVTLSGVGGVGKTRLAIAVAADVAPAFIDGCWLVELAPLSDGAEAAAAVAAALGAPVPDQAGVMRYLSDRRVLLVLDNCEHLLTEVAEFVDAILEAGEDVHVLATSREPLGVEGEHIRVVPSLGLPPADSDTDRAGEAAAVRLFVERGAAARDGFALDAANVTSVVEICRHLDGLPLAIELAAARVRGMPPAEISRRLGERFKLLGGGSRRAHERHRTLLAAVSWSHDLLDEEERTVFRRLAGFPASFTLDAAEAVVGDGAVDVVGCVLRLVDRSLVQFDPDDGRYQLLETLRQYGADRMEDAGETEVTAERHARCYLDLAAGQASALVSAAYPEARAVLTRELDNLRVAAEWCAQHERWPELRALCRDMLPFVWMSRPESGAWYERLIADDPELSGQDRVDALGELAYIFVQLYSDWARGEAVAAESDELAVASGLPASPWAGVARSMAAVYTDDYERTLGFAEAALVAAEARQDELAAIWALAVGTNGWSGLGRTDRMLKVAVEALRRAERLGNPAVTAIAAICVASSYTNTNEPDFAAGLDVLTRYANDFGSADITAMWARLIRGYCLLGLGQREACGHLAEGARLADRLNVPHAVDMALRGVALGSAINGHVDDAARLVGYAQANLSAVRVDNLMNIHVQRRLEAVVGRDDLAHLHEEGAHLSRRDILGLVSEIEARTAHMASADYSVGQERKGPHIDPETADPVRPS